MFLVYILFSFVRNIYILNVDCNIHNRLRLFLDDADFMFVLVFVDLLHSLLGITYGVLLTVDVLRQIVSHATIDAVSLLSCVLFMIDEKAHLSGFSTLDWQTKSLWTLVVLVILSWSKLNIWYIIVDCFVAYRSMKFHNQPRVFYTCVRGRSLSRDRRLVLKTIKRWPRSIVGKLLPFIEKIVPFVSLKTIAINRGQLFRLFPLGNRVYKLTNSSKVQSIQRIGGSQYFRDFHIYMGVSKIRMRTSVEFIDIKCTIHSWNIVLLHIV